MEQINKLIQAVLDDAEEIRNSEEKPKDRLPLEIMALNAVANAYETMASISQKDKFIPTMGDNKGNVRPILGKPTVGP